eukprot:CAMPEP_0172734646 /NCGR_PEP_ID=MMETSP1074-20121228/110420_1 /TAXON_ID=2916 /ORGANISM="Ceratium fusus, Strain PA161109" /LENGTH=221 /DNA_ID=CAMNT_0013563471 /DNA_START=12 /DNA_END=673 /DNA_ORIENTATION=+
MATSAASIKPKAAPKKKEMMLMSPASTGKKNFRHTRKNETGSTEKHAPDSLDVLTESNAWSDLEQLKLRTASAMDRFEFLASTSNRLVDFKEGESRIVDSMLRTQVQPGGRQQLALSGTMGKSRSAAALVFESQTERLLKHRTFQKRQNALTKYVAQQEFQKSGEVASQAAKESGRAARSESMLRPYPSYSELYNLANKLPGEARESPFLAVSVLKPYKVP